MSFDFLNRLPLAEVIDEFERSEGITIGGAFVRNALCNVLSGEKVAQTTYTIGINGRGTLQIGESEFRDLLASMIKTFEIRSPGYVPAANPSAD